MISPLRGIAGIRNRSNHPRDNPKAHSVAPLTHPTLPAKSVSELIRLGKAKSDYLIYATAGSGSPRHLTGELLKEATSINFIYVHCKGGVPAMLDVISGQAHFSILGLPTVLPHVRTGKLRSFRRDYARAPTEGSCFARGLHADHAGQHQSSFVRRRGEDGGSGRSQAQGGRARVGRDAVTALLGGHIDAHTGTPSSVVRMVEAGKIRVVGILAPKRIGGPYAATPTWTEQGFRAVMDTWRGVIGPRGMTSEQIAYWDQLLAKAVHTDTRKRKLERNVWEANYLSSAQTRKLFAADYAEYRVLLSELGLIK